ncbi:hypothetical protein [Phyllobacterium zundukense]|jgi:hypothetical protein|uniref:Uncharacterized protein n=1 Tax=Phyllobacterium zundukense TaxID=1867719 RepID=A0ACD4CU69_9HYPH|nr:hypothetical protein [Phyllobacterium zundukense]UXN57125.1 hypothetical protein N8E88_01475 [Phyllobacterium zundukense]
MQETDRVPEYVHDRIEKTNDLGHKYIVSVALCAVLIATIQGGYGNSGLFAESVSASRHAASETPLQLTDATMCSTENHKWHPLKREIDA